MAARLFACFGLVWFVASVFARARACRLVAFVCLAVCVFLNVGLVCFGLVRCGCLLVVCVWLRVCSFVRFGLRWSGLV